MSTCCVVEITRERFLAGETFDELLMRPKNNDLLWAALYKKAVAPPALVERAKALTKRWHLLVLSEDWCGDSINTLPTVQRLVEAVPTLEMRIIGRDANPDLMDAHLLGYSRSIPVILILDDEYRERGWWGPRPQPLQEWVVHQGLALPKEDRYREVRTWYARDHGETALRELLEIMENPNAVEDNAETPG